MEGGGEGRRERSQRDLCQKYYLGKKWFDLFLFHAVSFGPVYFSFPPHHGSWLVHKYPSCAWSPLSGGLCLYACCQELSGVCYSLLVPPASGLAIQRRNSIWKLSWFFPLVFPVFSSLSVYYDFVTGENRINSERKGHEVRLSEGFVSSERERQEVKAHSPGRKDWCVSDQCRPLCWNGDSGRVDRGRKKEPLHLKAKKKQTLS